MKRLITAGLVSGVLFAIMDGLMNGNSFAVELMEYYAPIARQSINAPAGVIIDLFYGFVISGIFFLISPSLPTGSGLIKGLAYGSGMWFFGVLMGVVSNWMMFTVPAETLLYVLLAGLVKMVVLGIANGLILKRSP